MLEMVRLRAIQTGNLICRNLYCVLWMRSASLRVQENRVLELTVCQVEPSIFTLRRREPGVSVGGVELGCEVVFNILHCLHGRCYLMLV